MALKFERTRESVKMSEIKISKIMVDLTIRAPPRQTATNNVLDLMPNTSMPSHANPK